MKRFSVIMPAFNAEHFIEESIRSALNQEGISPDEIEILVINDGSKDNTACIVEGLRNEYGETIQLISLDTNRGVVSAAIAGLLRAAGEYICLLDADDLWYPKKLSEVVTCLDKGYDLVLHGGVYIDNQGNSLDKLSERHPIQVSDDDIPYCIRTFNGGVPLGSCICFNKEKLNLDLLLQVYEKFKEEGKDRLLSHDTSIVHSILSKKNIKATFIKEKLFGYRIHEGNNTLVSDSFNLDTVKKFINHLQYSHMFGLEIYKLSGLYYEDRSIEVGFRKFIFYKESTNKEKSIQYLLREYLFILRNNGFTARNEKIRGLIDIFLHRLPPKTEFFLKIYFKKLQSIAFQLFKTTKEA